MPSPFAIAFLFGCFTALTACSNGGSDSQHNTQLSVRLVNDGPSRIQAIEYSVECSGTADPVLENDAGSPDSVGDPGFLEPVDSAPDAPENVSVWQGSVDLPPGWCSIDLRARNEDREIICTTQEPFTVTAGTTTNLNILFPCDFRRGPPILIHEPSFNFCPDLVALSCTALDAASTSCVVSFRDEDGACGQSCDPQTCTPTAEGLSCDPGPDPGVSTTITCTNALLDCTDDGTEDSSCVIDADTAGVSVEVVNGSTPTFTAAFFVACVPPDLGGTPGVTITCTAVSTDGDVDCDQVRVVEIDCPASPASP